MRRPVRISDLAQADLDLIWLFVARDRSIETANRVIESIVDKFSLFASHPAAGSKRNEIGAGVRSFPVGNYLIYYRRRRNSIEISRIPHRRRDQKKAWRE